MNTKMNKTNASTSTTTTTSKTSKTSNDHGIVDIKDFDPKKLVFSGRNKNKNGGYNVNITYDGKPMLLKLPKLRMQFGSQLKFQSNDEFEVNVQLGTLDNDPVVLDCHKKLQELDKAVFELAVKHYNEWFKKDDDDDETSDEVIKKLVKNAYIPLVKRPMKDKKIAVDKEGKPYADSLRIKLPQDLSTKNILIGGKDGNILNRIFGDLYGDKGYISKNLAAMLFDQGLHLVTGIRNNMKNVLMSMRDKILLRKRSVIETINDQLKNICHAEHSRHRSFGNFITNLVASLIAYSFKEKKPAIQFEEEPNATKQLPLFC